jgi:hypothetical protein
MKFYLSLFLGIISTLFYGQITRLHFDYDVAGNQINRYLDFDSQSERLFTKTADEINDDDLLKFMPEDDISYYPNPVLEVLYLKWELIENNSFTNVNIFTSTGRILKTYNIKEGEYSISLSFQDLQQGSYIVQLVYKSGEQKSITILKN